MFITHEGVPSPDPILGSFSFASLLTLSFGGGAEMSAVLLRPTILEAGSKYRTNQNSGTELSQ